MKKVLKWGCLFFIVTFGMSVALMLFNLPSEEEWEQTLAEATEQVKAENEKNDKKGARRQRGENGGGGVP